MPDSANVFLLGGLFKRDMDMQGYLPSEFRFTVSNELEVVILEHAFIIKLFE